MQQPINILERYWNYTSFKPLQEEIIQAVIAGEDTLALLPTGGGKSLCFQIPALVKEGICIVVSPLIALMKNQVQALQNKGIKAIAITSGIKHNELNQLLDNCIYGNYKFLYLSPERLQQSIVQERIKQMNVTLVAVDEAHCISQWGNDFRPSYKNITILRELKPHINIIALTASATPIVIKDIIKSLDFIAPKVYKQSFYRKNLAYMVFHEEDKYYRLEAILNKNKASSIIYVRNRKSTLEITNFLKNKGFSATYYHGGLSNIERDNALNDWIENRQQIMVATNAFGMGIDKPDVKTVIHLNLPDSIESYFQEAGRAGRNGNKAYAVILKNKSDEVLVENQFLKVLPSVSFIKETYRKLSSFLQIPYGEGVNETLDFNFNTFCKTYKLNSILVYNTLKTLDKTSIITLTKQFNQKIIVRFIISSNSLLKYLNTNQKYSVITKSILRTYGGIFEQETKINLKLISEKTGIQEEKILNTLQYLEKAQIITLKTSKTDAQITYLQPREDNKTINRISTIIKQQNSLKKSQVNAVLNYVTNNETCKSIQLLTYFGEENISPCGICSVCIKNTQNTTLKQVKNSIIKTLQNGNLSSRYLTENLNYTKEQINNALKELLEQNIITITQTNTYKLVL